MARRVVDPAGTVWEVSRGWFEIPRWSKRRPEIEHWVDAGHGLPDDSGGLALVLLTLIVLVVLWPLIVLIFLPLVFIVAGLVLALIVLAARLASLAAWTIKARSSEAQLVWHVRGTFRAASAVRHVAATIERGEQPLVDGRRPNVVEASRV